MEEWNQWVADSRSIETMRNIALDALEFEEDDGAFYDYAQKHNLSINGVCQIQERMNGDKYLFPICQFRLTLERPHLAPLLDA